MSNDNGGSLTNGAHHVGLTVPDLDEARRFFTDVLGYKEVGGVPEYPAVFLSDGTTMVTLWQAQDPARAVPFDRKNVIGHQQGDGAGGREFSTRVDIRR